MTWDDVIADQSLRNLPYRIETNGHGKLLLTAAPPWRGFLATQVGLLLGDLLPQGRALIRPPIQTGDGVRVPDTAWISSERRQGLKDCVTIPMAPEICVEILSDSNPRIEMARKMTLYFAKGAKEVWLCDEEGRMEFFTALSAPDSVVSSEICPAFPKRIDLD